MNILHKKQLLLLNYLLKENKTVTSKQLSLIVGVSVRTIKTYIQEINEQVEEYGIHIKSKAREGYWIEQSENIDKNIIHTLKNGIDHYKIDELPKFNYERVNYLIKKLLVVDYHLKVEDLMDEIYVSRSTITQDLKEVKKLLERYNLTLKTRSNYGIIIEGSEINKRLCISEYFFHFNKKANYTINDENMFNSGKNKDEYENIIKSIQEVCDQYQIQLSEFSINNMAIHISIAMRRCLTYDYIKIDEKEIKKYIDSIEYKAAQSLVRKLEILFHCMLPLGEVIYYTMHLQSKRISYENTMTNEDSIKLNKCISIILDEIHNNFDLDFRNDENLYRYLYAHIPPMIKRLQTNMTMRNPLVYDNLRRYLFATKVTHSAVAVIEQMYNVCLDINEFGYLLLYFNMAIIKAHHNKKIHIGIVSGRGRPESIMYLNEIQEYLSNDKYIIKMVDSEDIKTKVNEFDFLITTYTLKDNLKIPIYLIHNDTYISEIRKKIEYIGYCNTDLTRYFKEDFFVINLQGSTKVEVMNNLYSLFKKKEYIKNMPDENSKFKDDELGNGIVHLQDDYRIVRKEMCFIAVLKQPVLWDTDIIRVLILTKTKRDGDKDLPVICQIVSKWANNIEKVENLIDKKDFKQFFLEIKEENSYD